MAAIKTPNTLVKAEAVFFSAFIKMGFIVFGVKHTNWIIKSLLVGKKRKPPLSSNDALAVAMATQSFLAAAVRLPGLSSTCLMRSSALQAMLQRRGIEAQLKIGMRRADHKIEGHAWVELDGLILNETAEVAKTYEVMDFPL